MWCRAQGRTITQARLAAAASWLWWCSLRRHGGAKELGDLARVLRMSSLLQSKIASKTSAEERTDIESCLASEYKPERESLSQLSGVVGRSCAQAEERRYSTLRFNMSLVTAVRSIIPRKITVTRKKYYTTGIQSQEREVGERQQQQPKKKQPAVNPRSGHR